MRQRVDALRLGYLVLIMVAVQVVAIVSIMPVALGMPLTWIVLGMYLVLGWMAHTMSNEDGEKEGGGEDA